MPKLSNKNAASHSKASTGCNNKQNFKISIFLPDKQNENIINLTSGTTTRIGIG